MKNTTRKAITLCIALAILCHTIVPLKADADRTPLLISSVEALPYDVACQYVPIGVGIAEVFLPDYLYAVWHDVATAETDEQSNLDQANNPENPKDEEDTPDTRAPETSELSDKSDGSMQAIPVHWVPDSPFSGEEEAVFVFTPSLPSNYAPADGIMLPTITVYVQIPEITFRAMPESEEDDSEGQPLNLGDTFISDDVVYSILSLPESGVPGTVQIGDGINPALPEDCHGKGFYSSMVSYEGKEFNIVAVADRAFAGLYFLSYVHLPTSVLHVGKYAFAGSFRLSGAYFGADLQSIGEGAFDGCDWDLRLNFVGLIPPVIPGGLWLNHSRRLSINVNEHAYDAYIEAFSPHCNDEAMYSPYGAMRVITESLETEPTPLYAGVVTYEDSELIYLYFPVETALNLLVLQNMAEQLSGDFAPLVSWYIDNAYPAYETEADLENREVFLYRLNDTAIAMLSVEQLENGTEWFDHEQVAASFFEDFKLASSDPIYISEIVDAQYPLLWMEHGNSKDVHFIDIEGEMTPVASQLRIFAVYDVEAFRLVGKEKEIEPLYALNLDVYPRDAGCVAEASSLEAHAGSSVQVAYQAGEGYRFKEWYALPVEVPIKDNVFNMPAHDITLVAIFEPIVFQPVVLEIVSDMKLLSCEGGISSLVVSGNDSSDVPLLVRAFDGDNNTSISAERHGFGQVNLTFPANGSTSSDKQYVVRASLDGGSTWSNAHETIVVERAPEGNVDDAIPNPDDNTTPPDKGDGTPPTDGDKGDGTPPTDGDKGDGTPPTDGDKGDGTPPTDGDKGDGTPPTDGDKGDGTPPTDGDNGEAPPDGDGNGQFPPGTEDGGDTKPGDGGDSSPTDGDNGEGSPDEEQETPPGNSNQGNSNENGGNGGSFSAYIAPRPIPPKLLSGWLQNADGDWVYHNPANGKASIGWQNIEGKLYFFSPKGICQTGWISDGGKSYYGAENGELLTGLARVEGVSFYFTPKGTLVQVFARIMQNMEKAYRLKR